VDDGALVATVFSNALFVVLVAPQLKVGQPSPRE
jgi:hypothetical protein